MQIAHPTLRPHSANSVSSEKAKSVRYRTLHENIGKSASVCYFFRKNTRGRYTVQSAFYKPKVTDRRACLKNLNYADYTIQTVDSKM